MQKLKVGDMVQVTSGAERTRKTNRGKVLEIDRDALRVKVEGLRIVKKHLRKGRSKEHPDGGVVEFPGSIALASLALVCPKCDKPTRVGIRTVEDARRRFCKQCDATID